jgi:hypothetical protein
MKSGFVIALTTLFLGACASTGGAPQRGVGFNDFSQFELERARREAALSAQRGSIIPPARVNTVITAPSDTGIPTSALAAAGIGQTSTAPLDTGADPNRTQGLDATPGNPAPGSTNSAAISDEQSFDAVAGRETIESDAERRAAQAAARQQIQPTAVPDRPSDTGANIVEYALNAPNVKGQEWYSRSLLSGQGRYQRNCAVYSTPDDAQRDFMARGGPDRDRQGIDPDGDGFACGWDPAPFKAAFGN